MASQHPDPAPADPRDPKTALFRTCMLSGGGALLVGFWSGVAAAVTGNDVAEWAKTGAIYGAGAGTALEVYIECSVGGP